MSDEAVLLPTSHGPIAAIAATPEGGRPRAAVLVALQLTANYWLYSYIVWFFPLVIVALLAAHPSTLRSAITAAEERSVERPALVSTAG